MATLKKTKAVIIPADTFFYFIPLTWPHLHLTREELAKHYQEPTGWKAYMGNHYQLMSFENSILTVKVNPNDGSEHLLYCHIEQDGLNVACSCGMPGEKLCYHGFTGLYNMCWLNDGFDFREIYWPGFYTGSIAHKFLEQRLDKYRITISAKPEYGIIYRAGLGFVDSAPPALAASVDNRPVLKPGHTLIYVYALCFTTGRFRDRHLPMLLPFTGLTGKDGSKIVAYNAFLIDEERDGLANISQHQRQLNGYSKAMYDIVRHLDKGAKPNSEAWTKAKQAILELWQKALPLLVGYPYNQSYLLYWLKYLRYTTSKKYMRDCRYSLERPVLIFNLNFYRDYVRLSVSVFTGSKFVNIEHKPHLFVFEEQSNTCFLMGSIQDDELLIWMMNNKNKITILNEHFEEFARAFLNELQKHYKVFFSDRSGKRVEYDFSLVKAEFNL